MSFKYIELFAGIGGFRSAADALGGQCVFASEWDKFAKTSYKAIYGDVGELYGDITTVHESEIPNHDLLLAGFPCQTFSVAGKREGFDDTRGTLFFEILRIANEKKPRFMLLENVKGLLSHDKGRTFDVMCSALTQIGYAIDFRVLDSKYHGVPQQRERVYIACDRDAEHEPWIIDGKNVEAKTRKRVFDLGVKTFNFKWDLGCLNVTTRLHDVLEKNVEAKYYLSDDKTSEFISQLEIDALEKNDGVPIMLGRVALKGPDVIKRVYSPNGVAATLTTMGGGNREPKTIERANQTYRVRKLTPLECWRLQGFTDEQFYKAKNAGLSNTQLYKQAGNAVTTHVVRRQLIRLLKRGDFL